MYVDDDEASKSLVGIIIEDMGCGLVIASDGIEAIEKMQTEAFDLVLMDIRMPRMNGYEASRRIRRINKEIPIVALTADIMEWVPQQCWDAGMNGFVTKPINIDEFKSIIKNYLGYRKH